MATWVIHFHEAKVEVTKDGVEIFVQPYSSNLAMIAFSGVLKKVWEQKAAEDQVVLECCGGVFFSAEEDCGGN